MNVDIEPLFWDMMDMDYFSGTLIWIMSLISLFHCNVIIKWN